MARLDCAKVVPGSGCTHVISAPTKEEVLELAVGHAKSHGLDATDPHLAAELVGYVEED
jgi:predicted small metal-binding protein